MSLAAYNGPVTPGSHLLCAAAHVTHLREQDGEHVLSLEADRQVHERVPHVKSRGTIQQAYFICGKLAGNVSSWRLVSFHSS